MNSGCHRRARHGGFTLAEMLLTLAIASFIVAGVMTSYVFSMKGFRSLSNYNEIQAEGRQALDWFARDARVGIQVSSWSSSQVVLFLPAAVDSMGVVTSTNVVTHKIVGGAWYRIDGSGVTKQLGSGITSASFSLYDQAGNCTSNATQAVSVQVDAWLTKQLQKKKQTSEFLSARYRMRNTL